MKCIHKKLLCFLQTCFLQIKFWEDGTKATKLISASLIDTPLPYITEEHLGLFQFVVQALVPFTSQTEDGTYLDELLKNSTE